MEKETFDYSKVPYNFGLCAAAADCSHADTCLRRIAYSHASANITSNKKVNYAKGFVCTTKALAVSVSCHPANR